MKIEEPGRYIMHSGDVAIVTAIGDKYAFGFDNTGHSTKWDASCGEAIKQEIAFDIVESEDSYYD